MSTVLAGANVFDGSGADPIRLDVRIDDERIVEVGTDLAGDERVDLAGSTIMPGLIDCHVHVVLSSPDLAARRDEPFSYQFFAAAKHLEATLAAGFTTVRDAGGADLGVTTAVARGLVAGPDVVPSITMLSQTGGHGDGWTPDGCGHALFQPHPGAPPSIVDGVDAMRLRVREVLRAGAEVVKVCATGGVMSPRDDPRHTQFSTDELRVCVEEAAKNDVPVMAHAQGAPGIMAALRAGVRSIEHGIYADEACLALMRETGAWLVPTLMAPHAVLAASDTLPEHAVRKARLVVDVHEAMMRRAVTAGVRIALGTDAGIVPHGANAGELALMAQAGMAPAQVLVAATSSGAELLGLPDRGRVAPGLLADLVVIDGDPYDLTTHADRLRHVMKGGRWAQPASV